MPNPSKAILDPFTPLTIPEALLVAVCGLVVVFMMLAILALVIIVISKIVNSVEGKAAASASAAAPKAAPKPAAPAAPAAPAVDEGELVAVMMAAVAEAVSYTHLPSTTRTVPPPLSRVWAASTASGAWSSLPTTRSTPVPGCPARRITCCAAATPPSVCASP